MRYATLAAGMFLLMCCATEAALAGPRQEQVVTRVDRATAILKGRALVIRAEGMGRTPSAMGRGGRLIRRGAQPVLNKDGLLEYNLMFNAVPNYTGFSLKPIRASLTERSIPPGIKGVKIFGEFNEVVALVPEQKRKAFFGFGKKRREKASGETAGAITEGSPHP